MREGWETLAAGAGRSMFRIRENPNKRAWVRKFTVEIARGRTWQYLTTAETLDRALEFARSYGADGFELVDAYGRNKK